MPKDCDICDGAGHLLFRDDSCPRCEGTGEIRPVVFAPGEALPIVHYMNGATGTPRCGAAQFAAMNLTGDGAAYNCPDCLPDHIKASPARRENEIENRNARVVRMYTVKCLGCELRISASRDWCAACNPKNRRLK